MNSYLAGSLVRVANYSGSVANPTGGFRDSSGVLADPTVVRLEYRAGPGQPLVTLTYPATGMVKDATGLYHLDWDTTPALVSAVWTYGWFGTGALQAAAEGSFAVDVPLL